VSRFLERASIDLRCSLSHRWARNGWRPHAIHDQRTQIDLDILIPRGASAFFLLPGHHPTAPMALNSSP
jgi:hypothetical protein